MNIEEMTKDERLLLLYLETAAVDGQGKAEAHHMSVDDLRIAQEWSLQGFIYFKRISIDELDKTERFTLTHYVALSEEAFTIAHELRKRRAKRHEIDIEGIGE